MRAGDIIKIDCGATLDGYVGDAAISVGVGTVSPGVEKLLEITRSSLFRAMEKMMAGNRLHDVSFAVQEFVKRVVIQLFGIFVDMELAAYARGSASTELRTSGHRKRLQVGWVLAVEPMVNLGVQHVKTLDDKWTVVTMDGKPSSHFEHTIAVTADGPMRFDRSRRWRGQTLVQAFCEAGTIALQK